MDNLDLHIGYKVVIGLPICKAYYRLTTGHRHHSTSNTINNFQKEGEMHKSGVLYILLSFSFNKQSNLESHHKMTFYIMEMEDEMLFTFSLTFHLYD